MKPLDKYIKYSAYISIVLLIIVLIPMIAIGFFTHPLGDDYHYGQYAAEALRESGNILSVFPADANENRRHIHVTRKGDKKTH